MIKNFLNPEGHQNPFSFLEEKSTTIQYFFRRSVVLDHLKKIVFGPQ